MSMYNFIRPMLRQPGPNFTAQLHKNFFLPVTLESIAKAEEVWGGRFP